MSSASRTMRRPSGVIAHPLEPERAVTGPVGAAARLVAVWEAFLDGPAGAREVAGVAWPVVLSMLSFTVMGVVDTLFVARLGRDELAGAALGHLGVMAAGALLLGGLRGVNVVVAQAVGAGREALATRVGWAGAALAMVFGLGISALAAVAGPVAELLGGASGSAVHGFAARTFAIRCLAGPAWLMLTAMGQAMQGRGDTRTPMLVNVGANLANVALDALLVFGLTLGGRELVPALGVDGAALATSVSLGAGGLALLAVFWRRRGWLRPGWSETGRAGPSGARWGWRWR